MMSVQLLPTQIVRITRWRRLNISKVDPINVKGPDFIGFLQFLVRHEPAASWLQ
jgi:hypothetical protein